ncbi:sulfurtransferase [Nocardioides panaciterrulae]|uniref:Thiosulfate/3-mercaptopyruvate sulfurtransferase n=1 Tax=Nocardioides panaciterrulae TaxID=661492 RepID=A0A7Y9E611_9ACTN|nr:sulfurtransferase [Nocardioides panaciterrulae]NYD41597.1 thiosulfate/3-mercaptopyruvate sulfurtransferase [Nocardioides panaciterrulae]
MTGPLISADELLSALRGEPDVPRPTVLDVRYRLGGPAGPGEYAAGHVPGAAYVDLDTDLAAPPGDGGRHPLPHAGVFEAAMRRAGVSGARPVVVYDDWSGLAAGRAWWLLRHHGHPDVRVLDGGWEAWKRAGGEVETGEPGPAAHGDFVASPGHLPVVEADAVPGVRVLVDARAPERYRGETEPLDPVAGHIPGAVNVPTARNLGDDGRFRSAEELRALYAEVGATPEAGARGEVAAYCGSGVTAVHDIIAMEVAGIRAALYPGSWSGWITDPARQVER